MNKSGRIAIVAVAIPIWGGILVLLGLLTMGNASVDVGEQTFQLGAIALWAWQFFAYVGASLIIIAALWAIGKRG
jgi:hypothetical protein